jgi:hypothetical protein
MIWEHTWPEPRIIEVAICEDETVEEYTDVAILRFAGPLSLCLNNKEFSTMVIEQRPLEQCLHPVTLQTCRESRRHTLAKYRMMQHTKSKAGCFYFNPCRDVIWFSFDFTEGSYVQTYLRELESCYGEQLNTIEAVLVEESELDGDGVDRYLHCFEPFSNLKTILLRLGREDEDEDESEDESEDDNQNDDEETMTKHQLSKPIQLITTERERRTAGQGCCSVARRTKGHLHFAALGVSRSSHLRHHRHAVQYAINPNHHLSSNTKTPMAT